MFRNFFFLRLLQLLEQRRICLAHIPGTCSVCFQLLRHHQFLFQLFIFLRIPGQDVIYGQMFPHRLLLILQLCAMRCILSVSLPLCKIPRQLRFQFAQVSVPLARHGPPGAFPGEQLVIRIIMDSHPNVDGRRVFPDATNQQFNFIAGPRKCRSLACLLGRRLLKFLRFRPIPRRLPLTVDVHGTQTGLHFLPFLLRGARGLLRRFRRGRRLVRGRATSLKAFYQSFVKTSFDGPVHAVDCTRQGIFCLRRKGRGQGDLRRRRKIGGGLSKRQSGCHTAGARRHHCHCFICISIRAGRHRRHCSGGDVRSTSLCVRI